MKNKPIRKKIFITSIIILTAIITLSGLSSCKNLGDVSKMMETFEVKRGDITQTITTTGYVDSSRQNDYSPPLSGEVLHTLEKGDTFKKGDILLKIDNDQQQLLMAQAEENLNLAKSSLSLARISYRQALDANHIAIQLAETSARQSELSAHNAFIALENANNMAEKSLESSRIALENAITLLEEAESDHLITDTQLAQYEANVESARAAYESAKAQGTSSSKSAEGSYEQALLNQSATYWSNLSSTQTAAIQLETAARNIEQAEIQLRLSGINLELTGLDLDKNIIYAPYDGIVLSSGYKEGQYASPGMNAISVISDEFVIKADINEVDVVNLGTGQNVDIRLDAYYENNFNGKIIKISPISTNVGGVVSFELVVKPEIENAPELMYGLSASLDITTLSVTDVLYVPLQSVYEEEGKTYVDILLEDGNIEKREVSSGTFNYDYIEIKSGLSQGDRVLISPASTASTGNFYFQTE